MSPFYLSSHNHTLPNQFCPCGSIDKMFVLNPVAPSASSTVTAISLKLPPFWPSDPDVKFKQVKGHLLMESLQRKPSMTR